MGKKKKIEKRRLSCVFSDEVLEKMEILMVYHLCDNKHELIRLLVAQEYRNKIREMFCPSCLGSLPKPEEDKG